ncbi:putative virion structural protein [Erwinia phage Wellington]|jgi:hypothetical protein|uniref:Putative virion structural protein n=2 Tax=Wellingtonvirus wellington TaxID=2734153 RepID=A0A1B2IE24_9CAUD|nr:virion structural protein [Erwinia phage vB_EamM_Kwan]YP_009806668.1 virion structural protein [Erwinia phage Wellington]ANZ49537.1 putative virion structural protein [Erwinia phage vB_EamM_Kwan]AXF51312.1 putative virion structural protein [Erwinia phage Wellington]
MSDIIFQYPLDLKGTLTSNAVSIPVVLGSGKVNRSFAFPAGPFYADSFKLRATNSPTTPYKRGTDYELIFAHPAYMKLSGNKEVVMAVVVTNSSIPTDIIVTAQVVGGPMSANVTAIENAIAILGIDNKKVNFADLIDFPDTLPGAPAFKDVGDIFGFEYVITLLSGILDAIGSGDAVQLEKIKDIIGDIKNNFLDALNAHINATGNVHNLDIHDIDGLTATEIRALIAGVQAAIDATLVQIGDLKAADTALGGRIDAIVSSLTTFNDQLNTVDQNYQKMTLIVANLNSLVLTLQKTVNELKQTAVGLQDQIDDLKSGAGDAQQQIDQLRVDLTALTRRVTTTEGNIASVNQTLANHLSAADPHTQYLHKQYGGVVQANVHVNANLTTRDDVQADAGSR